MFLILSLSCRHSGGHIPQHAELNETICHALVSGGVPAVLEPVGVCNDDGKRPDDISLIPWSQGVLGFHLFRNRSTI